MHSAQHASKIPSHTDTLNINTAGKQSRMAYQLGHVTTCRTGQDSSAGMLSARADPRTDLAPSRQEGGQLVLLLKQRDGERVVVVKG